jgi:NhaP-type Na+/H+ or K+/H+ antiporter
MSNALDSPALVASLAMVVGIYAQVVARHTNIPGIVLLLAAGVLLGPDIANFIRPQALGRGLEGIVGFAVAVILFEGGLNLRWHVLRRQQTPIQRLVLAGSIITALGAALFAHLLLAWDWRLSFLFGTLVIVTGPTVITPILRRIHARHSVETILEAEGIFIDAVGATIAVVALEVLLAPPHARLGTAMVGILTRFGVGTLSGVVGGGAFALLMRFRKALPEGLANVAALASAIAIFETSNAIVPESGITAVILAGMVVGHAQGHDIGDLRDFKEQLTVLLVATLFVLLTADVRIRDVLALGMPGLLTVLALILVVRPINVFVSTLRTDLDLREKAFLSWLAPRGIVAAAVSSLFAARMADAGIAGGVAMRALVFLVIATTVVLQGMSAGLIASLLGLRLPREVGFVILGADEMARHLGTALAAGGEEVVFIDTNADFVRAAQEEGFKVVFGDGLDERALVKARIETRRACIGATSNESVNFLFAKNVHARAKSVEVYVAIERTEAGVSADMVKQTRSHVLFAGANELDEWRANAAKKRLVFQSWQAEDLPTNAASLDDLPASSALPLTVTRAKIVAPAERPYLAQKHDVVQFALIIDNAAEMESWLSRHGWTRIIHEDGPVAPNLQAAFP